MLIVAVMVSSACSGGGYALEYDDCISADGTYDTSMFYQNDLVLTHAADPGAIWVSEDEHPDDGGYFYVYSTTLYWNFIVARTKDFNEWENLGPAIDFSLNKDPQWCVVNMWAPECIYWQSPEEKAAGQRGKYYLFFTGGYAGSSGFRDGYYISVAVSDSPAGPFMLAEGKNYIGETIDAKYPTIDFNIDHSGSYVDENGDTQEYKYFSPVRPPGEEKDENGNPVNINPNRSNHTVAGTDPNTVGTIDVSPFIDDDGKIYLYLRHGYALRSYDNRDFLAVVEMFDMLTPKYETLTQLTYPGYQSLEKKAEGVRFDIESSSNLDEAPFMIKNNGVYYLTYAPFGYGNRVGYSVSVAVSSSPMGPFIKMERRHGNPSLCVDAFMDHMAGPGHHCFTRAGDEIFVFYHSLMDRASGNSNPRGIAYDRISFIDGKELGIEADYYGIESQTGTFDMIYSNGPTWSLQLTPYVTGEYRNVADKAKITATKTVSGLNYLNDGLFATHDYSEHMEFYARGKSTTVTLSFDTPQEVSALMVYNSADFKYAFESIDEIAFELSESPSSLVGASTKKVSIKNLAVNPNYFNKETRVMRIGGAAIARFNTLKVKKITIKISKHIDETEPGDGFKISDIVVVGKGGNGNA